MSPSIWTQCAGKSKIKSLTATAWRVVENQYQVSTRKLVDSQEEHELLERLIESKKPPLPTGPMWDHLHFLLSTPFRYPPLHHGSRFRRRHEPGVWYGSLEVATALTESAYLRLRLLNETAAEIKSETQLTAFSAPVKSSRGVDLTHAPFKNHASKISSKISYLHSQELGADMRESGVEAALYASARSAEGGTNIAVFSPQAFAVKTPDFSTFQTWFCYATRTRVDFFLRSFSEPQALDFDRRHFEVGGKLPTPA